MEVNLSIYERRSEGLIFKITMKDRFGSLRWSWPVIEEQYRECRALGGARSCGARGGRIGVQGTGGRHTGHWPDVAV
ncbi:hypothetical protein MA16_Dca009254 [Dendrobium catenatum]|uniref:Uncharacterized protein n=1 Tax=Dendrobium catenatum TaxID=906689 RepID=A0A2I0WYW1_9ASPA|nr:hypothetical protein MA16_Dca009254 [Dendrobium catenatum]